MIEYQSQNMLHTGTVYLTLFYLYPFHIVIAVVG